MAKTKNALPDADWFSDAIRTSSVALAANTLTALPATPLTNRREVWVQNDSGNTLYVGHSGIWAARGGGWEIANSETEKFKLDAGVVLYGVAAAVGSVIVMEFA